MGGNPQGGEKPPAHVDVLSLRLTLGGRRVFDGLSCRFPEGKLSIILGASGSGKSTLLRTIACLQKPDYGDVWVGGQEVTSLSPREARQFRRQIGMLFQGGALLDSLTVYDNVALPLREHTRLSEAEIATRVHRQFESVGLHGVDRLLPGELSGGMVKRAGLARALITEPRILLCDEPFSGLDPVSLRMIEALLLDLNERLRVTMILTSHHISSTMRMADEVVFLVEGAAVCGPVHEIQNSVDPRIRAFLDAASAEPMTERRGARRGTGEEAHP